MKKIVFLLIVAISFGAKAQENCNPDSTYVPNISKVILNRPMPRLSHMN